MKYDLHSLWLLDKVNKNYNNKIACILLFIFRLKKIRLHTYKKIYRWILLFFYLKHSSLFLSQAFLSFSIYSEYSDDNSNDDGDGKVDGDGNYDGYDNGHG